MYTSETDIYIFDRAIIVIVNVEYLNEHERMPE